MSNFINKVYLLALAGLTPNPALAVDEPPAEELEPIIVTATRTARTADETLASVTVITRAEIERRQVTSVQEVLRGVPGLNLANNGGLGKATSVFLRGTESDHVLVLIDGIRTGSATLGQAAFQDIPIDEIERIEIVRGPRSSLYGSEAVGGVIQIFTRKGGGRLKPSFSFGGGSHRTIKVSGGLSGGGERGWFNLNASHLDTNGFNACKGFTFPHGGGCFTSEPDNDGYRNIAGSVRTGYRFQNGLEMEGHLLHAEGENEFDQIDDFVGPARQPVEFFHNTGDFLQQVVGGKLRFLPATFWDVTLRAGRSLDESESINNPSSKDVFDTERVNVSFQNDLALAEDHLLTVGFDYYDDTVNVHMGPFFSPEPQSFERSRDDKAGFAQYQGAFDSHDLVLGVRHDDNEQFGGNTTGNVAWGYTSGNGLRLTAAWGTAFKAPTFNELYFPDFGSPDLEPEESWSAEGGVSGDHFGVDWSLNGYYTAIDEMITPVFDPAACQPPFFFCAQNLDEARIWGIEAVASTTLWDWDIAANLSLLDPENTGNGPNEGNLLPRRAQTMFRFDLDRDFGRFEVGATVYGEGRRFDDVQNMERLGGYVIVDLRAGIELDKNWSLEGRVSNLLDKDYETANLFNQDDRNFFLAIRYTPDAK